MRLATRPAPAALLLLCLAACQTGPSAAPAAAKVVSGDGEPHPALALAQGACGGCHAVERFDLSPNPNSPPFTAIANRGGLTAETLGTWLRDAHNYPQEMEFDLEPAQVEALVDYILTLQDPAYRPTIG